MSSTTPASGTSLPPDLFDSTTLISLASTVAILAVAYGTSLKALAPSTPGSYRFLFIWHLFDAGIHFFLEGSFLYHVCLPHLHPRRAPLPSWTCMLFLVSILLTSLITNDSVSSLGSPLTISLPARRSLRTQLNADIWAMTIEFGGAKLLAIIHLLSYGWFMREQIRDGLELIPYVLCSSAKSSGESLCQVFKYRKKS